LTCIVNCNARAAAEAPPNGAVFAEDLKKV